MAAPQTTLTPVPPITTTRRLPGNIEVWLVTLVLLIAAARAGTAALSGGSWILVFLIMSVFVLFLGRWICGRPLGILVTERNVMSLSRCQTILWTLVILSAYLTMVIQRIHAAHVPNPLDLGMDWRLWTLMGISTASLVGSPLLLESKKTQDPLPSIVNKASELLAEDKSSIEENRQGRLYSNADPKDARFTDIFQGDEIGNTAYIDPAKLQMFFFTVVIAASYAYQVFQAMHTPPDRLAMPPVSDGMVALLAISHAGYLGSKIS